MLADRLIDDRQSAPHGKPNAFGDEHPSGVRESFETRRDVDPVAVNTISVDENVTQMDANAELHAAILRDVFIARRQASLQRDGAANGLDGAGEFPEDVVARR